MLFHLTAIMMINKHLVSLTSVGDFIGNGGYVFVRDSDDRKSGINHPDFVGLHVYFNPFLYKFRFV